MNTLLENGALIAVILAIIFAGLNYFAPGLISPGLEQAIYTLLGIGGLGAVGVTAKRAKVTAMAAAKSAKNPTQGLWGAKIKSYGTEP